MPKTPINGIDIYYEVHGDGYPLVLSHGLLGTTQMWEGQVKPFSRDHRFITWDLRGHGQTESPTDPSQYSVEIMVDDLYQLLGHLGVEKVVVGGLSFGGYFSLHFYHHHPEVVAALILTNTGPGYRTAEKAAHWNKGLLGRADILEKGGMQGLIDSEYPVPDYTPRELMLTMDPIGLAKFCREATINPHGVDKLKDIAVPTLIVIGEDDVGFLAAADYMAARIPQSEQVVIANAGHGANIDQPEVFNQVVLDFLQRVAV